ncbi:multiple sugar transport system permease protein [Frigoribacterium sp. PhB160]|uniref:carbohydrate ABC transporter permease n=1 Tax=Frigoribacterium sp. PhB160 TaxID=2485192 RepID=UPI000F46503E|nr:sugar ABC transporter permease [Frigoribacterium sp. PhB160]ROS61235.1 multiple sugar transport system permease protein [Frigoribacterium sp. PhB160]
MADTLLSPAARTPRSARPGAPRRDLTAYAFLAPFLVLFALFVLVPAVYGLVISLHRWNSLVPVHPFIGLQNYVDLVTPGSLTFSDFWSSMRATGIFTVFSVPLLIVVPLLAAVLLNQNLKGTTFFRGVFFAPYVLGVAVIGVIWKYLLDPQAGVVNHLLGLIGLPDQTPWTVDVPWAWVSLVGVTIWWTAGLNTVILLAGLKGINADLYEAAALDGAGTMRKFWSVTLPGLRPVMIFVTTTTILASANMFGQSFLLTQGGPGTETRSAIMYIADQGLAQGNMGAASAMSYLLFAVLAVISVVNFRIQREKA